MALATKGWIQEINFPIYCLIIIFNLASWIDLNAIWVEMPLLVNRLPEGWDLPTYLIVCMNCSKVGLVVYTGFKWHFKDRMKEVPFVYLIIVEGAICLFILGFVWDITMEVNGMQFSVPLYVCTCCLTVVDCLCSVVFMPYMVRFKTQYMTAFFIGEGVCQIIPSLISLGQGVGERPICSNDTMVIYNETLGGNVTEYAVTATFMPPRFSVRTFFIGIFFVMCCSGVAFTVLHFHPYCKRAHVDAPSHRQEKTQNTLKSGTTDDGCNAGQKLLSTGNVEMMPKVEFQTAEKIHLKTIKSMEAVNGKDADVVICEAEDIGLGASRVGVCYWLFLLAWLTAMMYGITPSIQSYACLPYGNRAFDLSIRLGRLVNPIVCFFALFVAPRSRWVINILVAMGTVSSFYLIVMASFSPNPPMKEEPIGEALVILASILIMAFLNYARCCIINLVQEAGGATALMWAGAFMHAGSTSGSLLIFVINLVAHPFKSEPPCPGM